MKNILKEFRDFAIKGNVIDLAIGVVIGAAFGRIVTSLVNDIVMPPLSFLTGSVNLNNRFITLSGDTYETLEAAKEAGAVTLNIGAFANTVLDFLIVAFAIFFVVRQINRFKRKPLPKESNTKSCPFCLSVIALKASKCPHCTSSL
jgi:large conductance mechanosensitive channel